MIPCMGIGRPLPVLCVFLSLSDIDYARLETCHVQCRERHSILTSVPPIIRDSFAIEDSDKTLLPSPNRFAETIVDNDHRSMEVRAIENIVVVDKK